MPRVIDAPTDAVIDLDTLVARIESAPFDPDEVDALADLAPMLRALANNRTFLTDLAIAELKTRCASQIRDNGYSAQVMMLRPPGGNYLLRAAFWPAAHDHVVRMSGTAPFFYQVPHDHAFHFLTVGYLGPGYWSDYYTYDGMAVAGAPGEDAGLRFVERSRLAEGRMLLYRANVDVHDQLPPDALSVSINIMGVAPDQGWRRQYRFDTATGCIVDAMTLSSAELLLRLAVQCGTGNGLDLAERFAKAHPCEAMRWTAWDAIAETIPDPDHSRRHWEAGTRSDSPLVRMASRARLIQAG